jgi:membrane associated rhomboid family serine protease
VYLRHLRRLATGVAGCVGCRAMGLPDTQRDWLEDKYADLHLEAQSRVLSSKRREKELEADMLDASPVYRLNTYPFLHLGFFHALLNLLALTPLLERFEAENGTLATLAMFTGREFDEHSS